jgi:hypothetical protein
LKGKFQPLAFEHNSCLSIELLLDLKDYTARGSMPSLFGKGDFL